MMKTTFALSESGTSLIELLVATLLVGFLGLVIATILNMTSGETIKMEGLNNRDELLRQLASSVTNNNAIAYTCAAPENNRFARCFLTGLGSCQGNTEHPLSIYSASNQKLSGPTTDPAYFTWQGSTCNLAAGEACAFQVVSSFTTQGQVEFCGDDCQTLLPRPLPIANRLHELMTIQYNVTVIRPDFSTKIAEKTSSIIIPLHLIYGDTGCPVPP